MREIHIKVNDAHVHTGYFPRHGYRDPFYYSPKRILAVLNRSNVGEFLFSSTNATWDFTGEAMHREAEEMVRLAGNRAHPFFWVSGPFLERHPDVPIPDYYEGLKLHGGETRWLSWRKGLRRVLSIARERHYSVQIHTGKGEEEGQIQDYASFCAEYPQVRFDLAHGQPIACALRVLKRHSNAYVDTSFLRPADIATWMIDPDVQGRVIFGSDIPAPRRYATVSLTSYLRREAHAFRMVCEGITGRNVLGFLGKGQVPDRCSSSLGD